MPQKLIPPTMPKRTAAFVFFILGLSQHLLPKMPLFQKLLELAAMTNLLRKVTADFTTTEIFLNWTQGALAGKLFADYMFSLFQNRSREYQLSHENLVEILYTANEDGRLNMLSQ